MITSVYINHLETYKKELSKWAENNREYRLKNAKNHRLNEAQLLDIENTSKDRVKVISEILRVEREIRSLKIGTNNLFKTI